MFNPISYLPALLLHFPVIELDGLNDDPDDPFVRKHPEIDSQHRSSIDSDLAGFLANLSTHGSVVVPVSELPDLIDAMPDDLLVASSRSIAPVGAAAATLGDAALFDASTPAFYDTPIKPAFSSLLMLTPGTGDLGEALIKPEGLQTNLTSNPQAHDEASCTEIVGTRLFSGLGFSQPRHTSSTA